MKIWSTAWINMNIYVCLHSDDVFYNTIKREMQLQKSRNGSKLYDITDGTVYRENLKSLQKHGDLYLTFTMNTGVLSHEIKQTSGVI